MGGCQKEGPVAVPDLFCSHELPKTRLTRLEFTLNVKRKQSTKFFRTRLGEDETLQ